MNFLKKLIIALILGLFLCFGIKEKVNVNAISGEANLYGRINIHNSVLNFDGTDGWTNDNIADGKLYYGGNPNNIINGVRVRLTGGADYLLEYKINNEWIVAYSEARGEWNEYSYREIYVNGILNCSVDLALFLRSNLTSFQGYELEAGTYYLNNEINYKGEPGADIFSTGEFTPSFYKNDGTLYNYATSFTTITINSQRLAIGINSTSGTLSYYFNRGGWEFNDGSLLIPNVSLNFEKTSFIRPRNSTMLFLDNDPVLYLIFHGGFVERRNVNINYPQTFKLLPYNPKYVNGTKLMLNILSEPIGQDFQVLNFNGQAEYTINGSELLITNIKSDITVSLGVKGFDAQVDIKVNDVLSQSGIFSFQNNILNLTIDYRRLYNLNLTLINKETGVLNNVGVDTDVIELINTNTSSGVVWSFFGYNFMLVEITKYNANNEQLGSKAFNGTASEDNDRVFNAVNFFTNEDGFFNVSEGVRYEIKIATQGGNIPSDNEQVTNTMEVIFETFKSLLSLQIGWVTIGGILAVIISLSILVFIIRLWKGGS